MFFEVGIGDDLSQFLSHQQNVRFLLVAHFISLDVRLYAVALNSECGAVPFCLLNLCLIFHCNQVVTLISKCTHQPANTTFNAADVSLDSSQLVSQGLQVIFVTADALKGFYQVGLV